MGPQDLHTHPKFLFPMDMMFLFFILFFEALSEVTTSEVDLLTGIPTRPWLVLGVELFEGLIFIRLFKCTIKIDNKVSLNFHQNPCCNLL